MTTKNTLLNIKKYYADNKEEDTKKHDCVCGLSYSKHHKARHEKSIKHKSYIENQTY